MTSFIDSFLNRLSDSRLAGLGIKAPFTVPSGIVTTVPAVMSRIAREVPEIGFITTKTISLEPREGYREPVLYEYYPGCFVNAVGLTNPGARSFLDTMRPRLPLHDHKPLVVSIMGSNPAEFLECAEILAPIADAFELNLSCPHVKGAGQNVGSDPDLVRGILQRLKRRLDQPIIPKLSPNLGDIPAMARLCREEGADAIALINTVGPGAACDVDGNPILSHVTGGLSGAGVLPIGLRAVKEASSEVDIPIIASGGIGSSEDVRAYARAGASLFGVGSALAGMATPGIASFFEQLAHGLEFDTQGNRPTKIGGSATRTAYFKTRIVKNTPVGTDLFRLRLERGPACVPGSFFFLRLPGVGEKPFSPAQDKGPVYLVRRVGPFTNALKKLEPGDPIYMRGPYGNGFPQPDADTTLILLGGGTGAAPIMMAADRWSDRVIRGFFGFSQEIDQTLRYEILMKVPESRVVIDPPGRPGEVVESLAADMKDDPELYSGSLVLVCGPAPMMKAAVEVLRNIVPTGKIFTAREDLMRCGIGVCGSCGTRTGLRSCVDGPVMHPE